MSYQLGIAQSQAVIDADVAANVRQAVSEFNCMKGKSVSVCAGGGEARRLGLTDGYCGSLDDLVDADVDLGTRDRLGDVSRQGSTRVYAAGKLLRTWDYRPLRGFSGLQ